MANFTKFGPTRLADKSKGERGLSYYARKKYTCKVCDDIYVLYEGDACEECKKKT
jgi:hypothetical protein